MTRVGAAALLALVLGACGGGTVAPPQGSAPAAPKLLVTIVIDQMRFGYLEQFGATWTGGLRRMLAEGAVFERAFYPYLNTVTCAGHATISTGTLPYRHGVILNEWYQRAAGRRMSCTEDPAVSSVPYTPPAEPIGHSAHRLRMPSLGDQLRASSPQSRVVVLSMKPRSTAMLAGHGGTAVTWFTDTNVWGTSTAYAPTPVPEVQQFVEAHPVERYRSEVWERLRDAEEYQGSDMSPHERPRAGWTSTFPHPLAGAPGSAPERFYDLWERSPYSDDYLGRMAAALVRSYELGQREHVDHLAISFSSLDYVGHDFGPDSHEVQDTLFRLDRTLAELFTALDETVGRDRYVVGISADHGVSQIPEALVAEGLDAGRVLSDQVRAVAEAAMVAAHGPGQYVAHVEYTNVYLTEQARQRLRSDKSYVQPMIKAFATMPGIDRVFLGAELEHQRDSTEAAERAAALSYHPEESGEIIVLLKPNWIGTNTSAATHGSAQLYDQHVPVIFMGSPFRPGRYTASASPADLAPTLAAVAGVSMPVADGAVRREAFRH